MKQNENIKLIKEIFTKHFKPVRFIKIHGGQYQENGLPDIMILTVGRVYWLEVKRDWKDKPTKLQKWNVYNLKQFGFISGFVAGDEFKYNWNDEPIKLVDKIRQGA